MISIWEMNFSSFRFIRSRSCWTYAIQCLWTDLKSSFSWFSLFKQIKIRHLNDVTIVGVVCCSNEDAKPDERWTVNKNRRMNLNYENHIRIEQHCVTQRLILRYFFFVSFIAFDISTQTKWLIDSNLSFESWNKSNIIKRKRKKETISILWRPNEHRWIFNSIFFHLLLPALCSSQYWKLL